MTKGEIERATLYKGVTLNQVDHYVLHLSFITIKKELDIMSEDVNPTLVVNRLLFQVSIISNLYVARVFYPYVYLILSNLFKAQLMHELSRVRGIEKFKAKLEKEKQSHSFSRAKMAILLAKANK